MKNMNITLCLTLVLLVLSSCSGKVRHSIKYGGHGIIDYQYYNHYDGGLKGNPKWVSKGLPTSPITTYANMYVGEYLYVKWSTGLTGKVYERRIDLTSRLPSDMEDLRFYFELREEQLYVFVIWPYDKKHSFPLELNQVKRFRGQRQLQIYPDPVH